MYKTETDFANEIESVITEMLAERPNYDNQENQILFIKWIQKTREKIIAKSVELDKSGKYENWGELNYTIAKKMEIDFAYEQEQFLPLGEDCKDC